MTRLVWFGTLESMARPERLDGKVVLVSGAANGVGAAVARALIDAGASVALLDVDGDALREVEAALGDRADAQVVDVTDFDAVSAAVTSVVAHLGDIDAVIANAGIETLGWADEMPSEDFRRVVEVNLIGTWNTVRASIESLERRRGYILIVTSLSAVSNGPMNAAYNAAKAGVVAMARTMRLDLRHAGVDIGLSYLTYTDTPTARRAVEDPRMQSILRGVRGASLRPIPVDVVAQRYVRAIARRDRRLLFDRSSRLVVAMPELAQAILERMMGKQVVQVRRSERHRDDG